MPSTYVPGGTQSGTIPTQTGLGNIFSVAGEIIVGAGGATYTTILPGTDGQVIVADAAEALKLKWSTLTQLPFLIYATPPATASEGQAYINSGDRKLYVYFSGSWQSMFSFVAPSDGLVTLESGDGFLLLETGDYVLLE
jgi:outer membrane protein assembly factor BamB